MRLTPSNAAFYDMFSASADNLVVGAHLLAQLVAAPREERVALAAEIREAEHAGDESTHRILRELNSTFITPFDREDIYRLASRLDDVMDFMEAAADLVVLYDLDGLPAEIADQVYLLERACELAAGAMRRLRSMKDLSEYWIEANRLENEADKLYRRLVAKLFSGAYDALTVLKLKEVVDQLESAADALENVSDTVESIAVKES